MRGGARRFLETPVRRIWAGDGAGWRVAGSLLLPPAVLFRATVQARNGLYDGGALPVRSAPVPVISVGNLSVGGTGKTPVSRWIVERLLERGSKPALVARGYGLDELELHRHWNPGLPVIAASRRIEGVHRAVEEGADVCVLDDGFQHRALARDLDIVLVSPADPVPARLLPRGPYREPFGSLRRADLVLVTSRTGGEADDARRLARRLERRRGFPPAYPFALRPAGWSSLEGKPADAPEAPVVIVSSVARPEGVVAAAGEMGAEVADRLVFPDHHAYRAHDVAEVSRRAKGRLVVTTEKDAVKLRAFEAELPPTRVLTLAAAPESAVARLVDRALDRVLEPRAVGKEAAR